jgi:preprotein translocase subunit SecA
MIKQAVTNFLGTKFERDVRKIQPILEAIHDHEELLAGLTEEELRAQTEKFRAIIHERSGRRRSAPLRLISGS